MRNSFFIAILFLVSPFVLNGQDNNLDPTKQDLATVQIPASPTVASLGTYGDIPVNLNTGIPDISIPIYTLKQGDISVPISLSYHSGGVRLKDRNGLVGVKWSLKAGGQIAAINGKQESFYEREKVDRTGFDKMDNDKMEEFFNTNIYYNVIGPRGYSYTFPGKSGTFYLDGNDQNLTYFHVPRENKTLIDWPEKKMVDENGMEYDFGTKENTSATFYYDNSPSNSGYPIDRYVSAYFLDRITSPTGHEINFAYTDNTIYYVTTANEWEYYLYEAPGSPHKMFSANRYESKKLDVISTDNEKVVFEYQAAEGNDGSAQLKGIRIENNSKVIKYFEILYTNIGNASTPRYSISQINIYEGGAINNGTFTKGNKVSDYQFAYVEGELPGYDDNAADYYGYYNGATGNKSLVPKLEIDGTEYGSANCKVNPAASQRGMIKSIKYPTGATSYFTFEPNYVEAQPIIGDNSEIESIKTFAIISGTNETRPSPIMDQFYISEKFKEGSLSIRVTGMQQFDPNTLFKPTFYSTIKITNLGTGEEYKLYADTYNWMYNPDIESYEPSSLGYTFKYTYDLKPGDYEMVMDHNDRDAYIMAQVTWSEEKLLSKNFKFLCGGHRIKKILTKDISGVRAISEKQYEYDKGLLNFNAQYHEKGIDVTCEKLDQMPGPIVLIRRVHDYITLSSTPRRSFGMTNGSYVSYQYVKVKEKGNGYEKYEFDNRPDAEELSAYRFTKSITAPLISKEYKRGRIKNKWYYSEGGQLVKEENYIYQDIVIYNEEYLNGLYLERETSSKQPSKYAYIFVSPNERNFRGGCVYPTSFTFEFFSIERDFTELISKRVVNYFKDRSPSELLTKYNYDPNTNLLVETWTEQSDGSMLTTKYKYPYQYSYSTGSDLEKMVNEKHMIGLPVETIQKLDDKVVSAKAIRYNYEYKTDGTVGYWIVVPKDIYLYEPVLGKTFQESSDGKGFSAYAKRASNIAEDLKGNPLCQQLTDGKPITYLWGYNQTYLVAKIENAGYDQVKSMLGLDDKGFIGVEGLSNNQEEALRKLPNALVTTFAYEPGYGIISITDPNGQKAQYHYDTFGRLDYITDDKGNIREKYDYHYIKQ